MGVNTRRPILPAPTESIIDTTESATGTDLATDISRRTDKTSYSIPDDGSPITVPTRRQRDRDEKLSRSHHDSHTSLLIEYFEGGKGSSGIVSRPSVRVRVTPSSARKSRDKKDRFQITETSGSGSRKPAYTHRISLPSPSSKQKYIESGAADDQSVDTNSTEEEGRHSSRREAVDIEFVNRGDSEMSTLSQDTRYMVNASEVSSMPPDSMINASSAGPRRKRSQSMERESPDEDKGLLKTPHRQRSRSLSTERIAHRVAEKLTEPPKEASSGKYRSKAAKEYLDAEPKASRRRKHKYAEEDIISPESSLLSTSGVSSNHKSDQYSIRSGASKSSINNPKLLETVEDAIRRLILPELKELKKDQKVMTNKNKFERDMATSYSSGTSSRDELGRRLSKHASAPDVMKPKVVLNRSSKDEGIVLSPESAPRNKENKENKERQSSKSSETSDMAVRWANRPELTEQDKIRRQRSKGLRDAHAAARVGNALTAASLKHHDSNSSLGRRERRRNSGSRKSGSRKSTESFKYNETELVFQKHNVAPMPMHSEIDSELTRTSLLSERTASPTPEKRSSQFDIARGSPRQAISPASRTPTRNSADSRHELGMHHGNQSHHNISIHSASDRDLHRQSQSPGTDGGDWAIAAAAAANLLDAAHPGHIPTEDHYHDHTTGRGLSPIQSIASDHTDAHHGHYLAHDEHNADSKREVEPRLSIESLSSAPSTNLARSTRLGTSPQSQSGLFKQQSQDSPGLGYERSRQGSQDDGYYGYDEESRRSVDDEDSEVDFMDKVKEGHQVATGVAANPQFVHPMAVESAVASLMDPSVLESQISSTNRSQTDSGARAGSRSPEKTSSEVYRGSPLKQRQDADETSFPRRMGATSPPQSVTQSFEDMEDSAMMPANLPRGVQSPHADAESQHSESEINTNPSIIQGPIGGVAQGDHWGYDSRSPPVEHYYDTPIGGSKGLNAEQHNELDAEYYQTAQNIFGGDDYSVHSGDNQPRQLFGTPPGAKDEGYVSAANPMSPSIGTPKRASRGLAGVEGSFESPAGADDPFASGHQRHFSGYSHGVGSPLYDSATGRGIERIQSQDIVALMDHLTVRDAQRNARDTEILVTLVRSAAEMRTSFEQMKRFIAEQDDLIMNTNDRGHERTQQVLGGPRPLPPSGSRNRQLNTADEEDKRKNIFKRALKGLSLKSGNDLTKIEGMLEQLLDEVEALRSGQDGAGPRDSTRVGGMEPNAHDAFGPNGTPIQTSRSPYGSSSSRPVDGQRRDLDQRVSTVHEVDEDLELNDDDQFMTSHLPVRDAPRHERTGSLPLDTPPRKPVASAARSTETTPKAEKARKHKSNSSSIFPKISRWSKSTATSVGDNIRNSIQPSRKERPVSDQSRSGSDLAPLGAYKADYYDPQGDDRIRSTYTFDNEQDENRPPSPLVPSQVSEAPKYRGHRGSLELQHPQPRQGPTGRYQSRLETEAQTYGPISPTDSDQWESNPSPSAANPAHNRNSGVSGNTRLSPISDAGYSETSSRTPGPPRPPKIKDDGPLIPERPLKVTETEEQPYSADRVVSRSSAIRSPPTRKPTGPRPLTSAGPYSPGNVKRTRYRGSPAQIDYDDEQY